MNRSLARLLALAALLTPVPAGADAGPPGGARLRLELGVLAGTAQPDADLADYQWDVTPRGAWGAQALVAGGRGAAGLRLWRTRTTQSMGAAAGGVAPTVTSTTWDVVGRGTLGTVVGVQVFAAASVGRVHLAYTPERVAIDAGGVPVSVELAAMDEWKSGVGAGIVRSLAGRWSVSLAAERSFFGLDTAHRDGAAIVRARERFGEWNTRLGLAGSFGLR